MKRIIKDISSSKRRIDPKEFSEALGAVEVGAGIDSKRGPVSLFFLRRFIVERLRSTGGRPKLAGTSSRRNKIPLFEEDWAKLEEIARYVNEEEGVNVSSGQIASALIHAQISKLHIKKARPKIKSRG